MSYSSVLSIHRQINLSKHMIKYTVSWSIEDEKQQHVSTITQSLTCISVIQFHFKYTETNQSLNICMIEYTVSWSMCLSIEMKSSSMFQPSPSLSLITVNLER